MGLNANQKRAVEYLEGPLLVLAGPGTGKTQLLSSKVAYILQQTDTNPGNILCLTFTETGAKNMRERLKTMIGKDALKVNIGTYHAFGSEILAQYKNYAVDYERKLDAAIDEVTQYKIVRDIQRGLPGTDILKGDSVKDIISVIGEAKAAGLSEDDLQAVAEQNIEDSKILSEAVSPFLQKIVPRKYQESYDNAYAPIYEILAKYADGAATIKLRGDTGVIERNIAILARDLKAAMIEAESAQKVKPLSEWKDKYFEKDNRGEYRLKDRVANKKLLSIAGVMKKYEEYLRENGLYDFNDMIEEAGRVLREDEGFRMTLAEKYQFIMLDEFQDTNPSQFAIVKLLTDYERPNIMAVGDDDQAIYEFQGALASNLTDFQEHYGAEVIPLVENYRSTQEILDFSREVIRQAPDRFADKELIAHKAAPEKSQIYRYEFQSADAEYGFIAEKIAELVRAGIKQSEIAVISYKTKYFEPLLPYLKAHEEIKIAYEKRDNLFEDEKIHEMLGMARFIWEMANSKQISVPILEVLTYPCLKLPVIEVVRLVEKAKREKRAVFDVMSACENSAITGVAEWIGELVAKSFNEPLDVFMGYLIDKMDAGEMEEYERFRFYENLAALKGKLAKHFGEKSLKLQDLIEMVDDYTAAGMALNVNSPYRDADEAVQILTAHKAKGLEFEYVFIISADHTAWGKGKGNNNLLALPKNLMQIRHTGTTDGEKLRILYVALTRAKSFIYITNSLHDFNDKSPERLEYFEEYAEGDEVISPFLPNRKVELMYGVGAPEVKEENLKNWLRPFMADTPDMRAIYKERVEKWRMSASALTSFVDVVYAGPEAFFKSYVLQAPREPETKALALGNLIHTVFEAVTNKGISDEEAEKLFLAELTRRDLPVEVMQEIREKGPADLAVALESFGEILRQGRAEVDFATEKLVIDGVPVTGKIDHIIIDEDTKTIEIYDFKTSEYHKEKWQSHATLYKYMLQLLFYKLLLNASPRYAKYRVARAHILFVTPDKKDGAVYDKVYDFSAEDEKALVALMRAVYAQVVNLYFLDDEELMVRADKTKGLKDIKEFIELLLAKNAKK
ncbi:ATP-dependent helicase [Candidatus Saccharibacteria bacterium]|nr:ATP-dependent helicase [Candidatus Saccharibacteria bacterium]